MSILDEILPDPFASLDLRQDGSCRHRFVRVDTSERSIRCASCGQLMKGTVEVHEDGGYRATLDVEGEVVI